MHIQWSAFALADREAIVNAIASDSPSAAIRVDLALEQSIEKLQFFPEMGRIGRVENTRELVIGGLPYLAAYRIDHNAILILRILHGALRWPEAFEE